MRAEERETISREPSRGSSAWSIAKILGRHHSAIAREIERNGGAAHYRALAARKRYESFTVRPKEHKLVTSSRLHDAVNEGLGQKWSAGGRSRKWSTSANAPPRLRTARYPSFWEGDLIIRKSEKSQIATLAERTSWLTMLVWIPYDRCADRVAKKAADTEHQYANIKARYKLSADSIFSQLVNNLPAR